MYLFSTKDFSKAILFAFVFSLFSQSFISAQATFRISKPIIGTNQICSSTTNYYNYLSYAFSSNVVNSSGNVPYHFVELSNENGLIQPREIGCFAPYVNVIYVGNIDINGQNLPPGGGYKIRVFSKSPSVYSDYAETFTVLASPARPVLNVTGSINLCPGLSQTLTVTNPDNNNTYQWQNNSSNIVSANATSYNASTNGYFAVKATNSNGCGIISSSVSVSLPYALNSQLQAYLNNNYSYGGLIFSKSNQPFRLTASIGGGKSPYNFTLNDGTTNRNETNITYSKDYNLVTPSIGTKVYTISTLTDACGSQVNNSSSLRVRINDSKYCSVTGGGTTGIKSFSIQGTTINNLNSGMAADGWGEYLSPANINANVNYNFAISNITQTQRYFAIWADLNQNGTFDSNEKIFPTGTNSYSETITNNFTGVLKLPANTYNGQTRIRIYLSSSSYSPTSPCYSTSDGEIEDYMLNVFNGVTPTVITTDSLPRLGICIGNTFPTNFTITGNTIPQNTNFKVEGSYYSDFSYPITLGTGTTSPIISTIPNSFYYYSNIYVRVVPVNTINNSIINISPNQLIFRNVPDAGIFATFYRGAFNSLYWGGQKNYSVSLNATMGIYAQVYNAVPPVTVELSDGRVFTKNISSGYISLDSNFTVTGENKYKIVRVSDNVCTNFKKDSAIISGGSPFLKVMKVQRNYNDTTSLTRLCGNFYVRFAGKYLDTTSYRFYHVQISDANGSFNNPQDIGHVCLYRVLSEEQGGQIISCYLPNTLPSGTGYRLRVIEKIYNTISPIYPPIFTVETSAFSFTSSLSRGVINEGEVTALNLNFTGGSPPYSVYIDNTTYTSTSNSSNMTINLGPLHGRKYVISPSTSCGGYSSNNTNTPLYLNVKTLDKDNSQWYVKPIQNGNSSYYNYDIIKNLYLLKSSDTLFKRPFSYYSNYGIINAYYDYNSASLLMNPVIIKTGEVYSLAQFDNRQSTGYDNLLTGVWIDSNQDGDFDDAGEELAKNQFAQPWNISQTQNFTIPNTSNIGFSRLRVRVGVKQYDVEPFDFNASNPIEKNANTYDIPIVVLSNSVASIISTPKISGNTLCNGNSFSVDFSKYGIPAGTSANVELSDVSGNFSTTPIVIGQGTTSPLNVILPLTIPSGNYNIRVISNGVTSPVSPSFNVTTNQLTSMVDGDWHAGSTWSCGRVPTYVDATTVAGGTTVTVFSGDARVGSIITNGVLSFLNGTTLRFRQP
jgi:hypothetical protein